MSSVKVKIRTKPIGGNRESLYLDFYPEIIHPIKGKKTRREFLKMYIPQPIKVKKRKDSKGNIKIIPVYSDNPIQNSIIETEVKETRYRAEKVRERWQNELGKPEIYSGFELDQLKQKEKGEQNFVEYFLKLANKRKSSNYDNWVSAYKYVYSYTKGSIRFSQLDVAFGNDFRDYLLTAKSNKDKSKCLSQNSALSYFNKFKATLKQAYKEGYLITNLNDLIECIPEKETIRQYLTEDEINQLIKTECPMPILKKAAIFSAMTGLAYRELKNLKWGDFHYDNNNGYSLPHIRQKTENVNFLPISAQAYEYLGEQEDATRFVFEDLKYSDKNNNLLREWVKKAGINKYIRFHEFRHTYATMLLTKGEAIYTVQSLLGHKHIKTTQIYGKVINLTKIAAVESIKFDIQKK